MAVCQNLQFVAYSAPERSRSKLLALWHLATSDGRWLLVVADLAGASR